MLYLKVLFQESLKEPPPPSVFLGGEILEKFFDEYDPMKPNDYEKMTGRDPESRERQKELDRFVVLTSVLFAVIFGGCGHFHSFSKIYFDSKYGNLCSELL